ncbi:MAG: 2-hydroxyacid dehydrogenase [Gammaproteobacteria bacterium]|nr:2-hydroxyacid dehydrogenase [Gammaproteobacteria bacterium]
MKIAMFSSKQYDIEYFSQYAGQYYHQIDYFDTRLSEATVKMAEGYDAVCVFVNDRLNQQVLDELVNLKIKTVAFRCAGFNNLDLNQAKKLQMNCVRVPAYSPHAVAEHVLALLLTLYRSTHKSYNRVREGNFSLEGLSGVEISGKTVGIIGTGNIGSVTAQIFRGFNCEVLAYDIAPNHSWAAENNVTYVELSSLYEVSDIITLHCPLDEQNRHMINAETIRLMRQGVTLINTSRGGLIDTQAVYEALKRKHIGYLAIDVYEEEANLFFEDLSTDIVMDDLFMRLTTFPNVLISGHQGFFTTHALNQIAKVTLQNLQQVEQGVKCDNVLF